MGGSGSREVRKVKHNFYGEVTKNKNFNKWTIYIVKPILNEIEFKEWEQKYKIVNEMNKDNLLVPENYSCRKISSSGLDCRNCCGAEMQTEMAYEDVDFALYQEITNRRIQSSRRYYTEPELMLIMYKILSGAKQFERKSLPVGDIRTKQIVVTPTTEIKLINIATYTYEITSIQKVLEQRMTDKFYFAPEEVEYLQSRSRSKEFPNPKTEAWSVGLCVLEAATLESSEDLYEMPTRKINQNLLKERIAFVDSKYKNLSAFLAMILRYEVTQRLTTGECWSAMRPYGEKITQLESFRRDPQAENASIGKFRTSGPR